MTKSCGFRSDFQAGGKIYYDFLKTCIGWVQLAANSRGIVKISFVPRLEVVAPSRSIPSDCERHLQTCKAFLRDFAKRNCQGEKNKISICWKGFTPFQKKVYETLWKTRFGETLSYSELAQRSGYPRAERAVGNVLNQNPIPVLIPCHRVIRKDGSLGGFSAGLNLKKKLLKMEGVVQN